MQLAILHLFDLIESGALPNAFCLLASTSKNHDPIEQLLVEETFHGA